jgi:hypothetical protein
MGSDDKPLILKARNIGWSHFVRLIQEFERFEAEMGVRVIVGTDYSAANDTAAVTIVEDHRAPEAPPEPLKVLIRKAETSADQKLKKRRMKDFERLVNKRRSR